MQVEFLGCCGLCGGGEVGVVEWGLEVDFSVGLVHFGRVSLSLSLSLFAFGFVLVLVLLLMPVILLLVVVIGDVGSLTGLSSDAGTRFCTSGP